jgi:ribonuclease III
MALLYLRRQKQLQSLINSLGLTVDDEFDWLLLDRALIHATADPLNNYEQLEFVGDAVVKLAAAEFLYSEYAHLGVGDFTALRSVLVSDRILAQISEEYGFEHYLVVATSAQSDRAGRSTRLADALESVLAALYLQDHTLKLVQPWLNPHFHRLSEEILADPARQNYKAALQNWTQAKHKILPEYRHQELSQVHNDPERFGAEVWLQGEMLSRGTGRSIKAAEQDAARSAFLSCTEAEAVPSSGS